jgi:hypothetical protein
MSSLCWHMDISNVNIPNWFQLVYYRNKKFCAFFVCIRMNGVFACCRNTRNLNRYVCVLLFWILTRMTQSTGKMIITMAWFISRVRLVVSLQYTVFCEVNMTSIPFPVSSLHKVLIISMYIWDIMCSKLQVIPSKLLNGFQLNLMLGTHWNLLDKFNFG